MLRANRTLRRSARNFSFRIWPVFIRYANVLRWSSNDNRNGGCTFAEIAMDFEIVIGMAIDDLRGNGLTTWATKAEIMKTMFRLAKRYHARYSILVIHKRVK